MNITFLDLLLLGLASFRLTRLFVYDKITAFIRNAFIREVEEKDENGEVAVYLIPKDGVIKGFFGELLSCYWCTGIWSSLGLYGLYMILPTIAVPVIIILAISGVAAIIETVIQNLL